MDVFKKFKIIHRPYKPGFPLDPVTHEKKSALSISMFFFQTVFQATLSSKEPRCLIFLGIQVCPKEGIAPTFLCFFGWENRSLNSILYREGSGYVWASTTIKTMVDLTSMIKTL